jgi:hypothetical protein
MIVKKSELEAILCFPLFVFKICFGFSKLIYPKKMEVISEIFILLKAILEIMFTPKHPPIQPESSVPYWELFLNRLALVKKI